MIVSITITIHNNVGDMVLITGVVGCNVISVLAAFNGFSSILTALAHFNGFSSVLTALAAI
jgi:hypothetical protein